MSVDGSGRPHASVTQCNSALQISDISFHGGISALILNLFKGLIKSSINKSMNGQLCSQLTTFINGMLNKELATLNLDLARSLAGSNAAVLAKLGFANQTTIDPSFHGVELDGTCVQVRRRRRV